MGKHRQSRIIRGNTLWGQKCGKNVGNFASEKAKFCEKSRILGAMQGPNVEKCKVSKTA